MNEPNNNLGNNIETLSTNSNTNEPIQNQSVSSNVSPTINQPEILQPQQQATNNQTPPKKGGNFKYILAFIFLIAILAFVFFLPEISMYVESKKQNTGSTGTSTKEIENGILTCSFEKDSDETNTYYEIDFKFTNKKLITSNLVTTIESTNETYLATKKAACDMASATSLDVTGINTSCSLSLGILTISESYTHKDIDKSAISKYVEASGTAPEFNYQKNIYDIKTKMEKSGYDCSISSQVE